MNNCAGLSRHAKRRIAMRFDELRERPFNIDTLTALVAAIDHLAAGAPIMPPGANYKYDELCTLLMEIIRRVQPEHADADWETTKERRVSDVWRSHRDDAKNAHRTKWGHVLRRMRYTYYTMLGYILEHESTPEEAANIFIRPRTAVCSSACD